MNINEMVERALEVLGLALIKVLAGKLLAKSAPTTAPGAIICVQVPPELTENGGGEVEIHWTGRARVPGQAKKEKEETK